MDYVLIDNDKIMHLGWALKASKTGAKLTTYFSIQDFLESLTSHSRDTNIYIDSDLGNGIRGEVESKKLHEMGFKNIYLSTGYTDLNKNDFPWLLGINSKSPPF